MRERACMNNMRDRQGRFDRRLKRKAKQIERVKGMGEGKSPSERKKGLLKVHEEKGRNH